jgi:hypothetical protein
MFLYVYVIQEEILSFTDKYKLKMETGDGLKHTVIVNTHRYIYGKDSVSSYTAR